MTPVFWDTQRCCYLCDKKASVLAEGWLKSPCKLSCMLLLSQVAALLLPVIAISYRKRAACISTENQTFVCKLKGNWNQNTSRTPTVSLFSWCTSHPHILIQSRELLSFPVPPSNPLHLSVCSSQHYHAVSVGSLSVVGSFHPPRHIWAALLPVITLQTRS